MDSTQTTMNFTGEQLRDIGISQAVDHAEQEAPGWTEQALDCLMRYPGTEFQAEDVREWAHSQGLPLPPHPRAWGGVIVRARKQGKIKFAGYRNVSNPKAHRTPAGLWRKT